MAINPTLLVPADLDPLFARLSACESRLSALEQPAPPIHPPVPDPDPPAPPTAQTGTQTVTAQGYTFTFSETDVNPDGSRVLANGEPVTDYSASGLGAIYGDRFHVLNGIVYVHTKAGLWHGFTGSGWTTTPEGADGNPEPITLAPVSSGVWTPPPAPPSDGPVLLASPDGTIVDRPWQPINGLAGNPQKVITLVMSDRKGSKDGGAHYIGYECCGVFPDIDPRIAEGVAWTPATDDGAALAPTWIPLDEQYQPIADGRQHTWMALRAGEKYGYAFKVEVANGGILYQINGKGLCYGPTGAIPDPLVPPAVLPAPAVGARALIGGWRLPACWGSLGIDFTTMRAIVGTGDHTQAAPMLDVQLPPMGTGTDPSQWPEVIVTGQQAPWWGMGFAQGVIRWRGKWWVCPRTYYAKDGATELPVVLFADDGEQFHIPSIQRQAFAGFIKRGPGLDPLIGGGGNESGEGWIAGPTLATLGGQILLTWGNPVQWEGRAPREPNYAPVYGHDDWPALAPRNGVGRWASDRVYGGGLMLGGRVHYWPTMGVGVIDYGLQNDTFSVSTETHRYQFDPTTKALTFERTGLGAVRGQEIDADGRVYLSIVTPQPMIQVFANA